MTDKPTNTPARVIFNDEEEHETCERCDKMLDKGRWFIEHKFRADEVVCEECHTAYHFEE